MQIREIQFVDNYEGISKIDRQSVTLAYLDPPFMSGRSFDAFVGISRTARQGGEGGAFNDKWSWSDAVEKLFVALDTLVPIETAKLVKSLVHSLGRTGLAAYLVWITPRLCLSYEALSREGSLYLHCDPSSSHYLKLLLDKIFGPSNFRNEIIWRRTHAHSSSHRFGPVHDVILYYSKSSEYIWNQIHSPYDPSYIENYYTHHDKKGKYQLITCTAPGDRIGTKAHYNWRGKLPPPGRHWAWKKEQMEEFEAAGLLAYSSNGIPRLKRYVHEGLGVAVQDVWTDIARLDAHSAERTGYETQKPVTLLERIITASSRPDSLILDPFCGSGTTLVAAERLGRSWIGMDFSLLACSLALGRVRSVVGSKPIRLFGFPDRTKAALDLLKETPLGFGAWGTGLLATLPERRFLSDSIFFGTAQLGRKTSLVSLVPLVSRISPNSFNLVNVPSGEMGAILSLPGLPRFLADWANKHFSGNVIHVPLQSMISVDALKSGIVPEVLVLAQGKSAW